MRTIDKKCVVLYFKQNEGGKIKPSHNYKK